MPSQLSRLSGINAVVAKQCRWQGSQIQTAPRAALWRWCKNGGIIILLGTPYTSYSLWNTLWATGKPFQAVYTFFRTELVHSLVENFQTPMNKLNDLNLDCIKIPETRRGPHKCPRGPHAASVTCPGRSLSLAPPKPIKIHIAQWLVLKVLYIYWLLYAPL